jgi:hypothetical protein
LHDRESTISFIRYLFEFIYTININLWRGFCPTENFGFPLRTLKLRVPIYLADCSRD